MTWFKQHVFLIVNITSSWPNGKLTKWQDDETSSRQYVIWTKSKVSKSISWQNGNLTKWKFDKISSEENVKLTKRQVDETAKLNGKLTTWLVNMMTGWQNGMLTKHHSTKFWRRQKVVYFQVFFQKGPHYITSYLTQHQVDKIVRWQSDVGPIMKVTWGCIMNSTFQRTLIIFQRNQLRENRTCLEEVKFITD